MDSDALSESSSTPYDSFDSGDENEGGDVNETCCFNKKVMRLPQYFCSEEEVFNEVLCPDTWKSVLNSHHAERLMKFLPVFPVNDEKERYETLRKLLKGENFRFGSPFKQFFNKLKDGFLSADVVEVSNALKQANFREYKNQQREYSYNMLQDILMTRKKLLDASYNLPPGQPVKMQQFVPKPKDATLSERTRLRYFSALQELREEIGEPDTSSEDENYPESIPPKVSRKMKKQFNHDTPLSPELTRITSTMSFPSGTPGAGHLINHSIDGYEVSEERYREMLIAHKGKILYDPERPELKISQIDIKGITMRCNLTKRTTKSAESGVKKKIKVELPEKTPIIPEPVIKMEAPLIFDNITIKQEPVDLPPVPEPQVLAPPVTVHETEAQTDPYSMPEEAEELHIVENALPVRAPSPPVEVQQYPTSYFSLLRDIFYDTPEQKCTAVKIEDKVKAWQTGYQASSCDWIHLQESWSDLVASALRFLAGDLINMLPETFVPYLDYKEKQQQWQWIGSERDSDEQMFELCQTWLETKDDISSDILEASQASPPPPRVTTGWTVRTTADEEKRVYRMQECVRYQNPHKAFTFKVHGYEAVVGPVKGVYGKENGVNKAREHSLLTSDRPPFVTILSLVRDSAARLPNGEGTRADICELLKDSQYLAPCNDQQIHTVVSGALDRLHYEKDPCVKYDVNRKLWIYLHRHRTEEEFERIHQAQAAAAKARKAVQKKLIPKYRPKETFRSVSVTHMIPNSENVTVLNVDLPSSLATGINPQNTRTPVSKAIAPGRFVIHTIPASSSSKAEIKCNILSIDKKMLKTEVVDSSTYTAGNLSEANKVHPSIPKMSEKASVFKTSIAPTITISGTKNLMVTPMQLKSGNAENQLRSMSASHLHDVLNVDLKPSSPSFVGQPPVLQPIMSHDKLLATIATSTPMVSCTTTSVAKPKVTCTTIPGIPGTIAGFQTIVIKQEPGMRNTTIPVLSIEERHPSSSSSAVPVVARLVHGQQYLSFGNIMASSSTCPPKPFTGTLKNIRVQGGNICQQVLSASAIKVLPAPVSGNDTRLPVIALKTPVNSKDASVITTGTTTLNLTDRLYQIARNAAMSKDIEGKKIEIPISSKDAAKLTGKKEITASTTTTVYSAPITISSKNLQSVIKLSPK